MPLILDRSAVLDLYARAGAERWVVPTFCTENLTTTEAVLSAAVERARELHIPSVPVSIAMTVQYRDRPQAAYYTHTRRWDLGLKLFLADVRELAAAESPFAALDVMVHLDHIQWDVDAPLLEWDLSQFSSIMYDASSLPFDENIRRTAEFVSKHGRSIVIEGACDEIADASGKAKCELTTPDAAARYHDATKVDFLVANVGTEHRASSQGVRYRSDLAREISRRTGPRLVVHGASSAAPAELTNLFSDGVAKVNIWTALERDSSPALLRDLAANAAKVAGADSALAMEREGLIGPNADTTSSAALSHFTTTHRQEIVFARMKSIALDFLRLWYT
jgi:fructose-bisphosphate aldolase class II